MSDEEEKRCPLCAEEMDWTDQQLNPCKCGYQICVWCWNHIMEMDMSENNETGGRCPACRRPYDKEKVAGMEANFERVVSNSHRKKKAAKGKPKPTESRKDLSNVRVIQRTIAYVIGLPLSIADENLLQRKDYFGQYGKVTKISLSRTAGGTVHQFINDTCSVYVTYLKEVEAVRCIQYVHGFMLEGRFLRASFGTAKYCHAWLRNVLCNNPACLYLHSIASEEDSFGKDEVAAVHTRNRLQQVAGDSHSVRYRSGNMLPPPTDYLNDSAENLPNKSASKDIAIDTVNSGDQSDSSSSLKDKDWVIVKLNKPTTLVDIVARSSSSGSEKDGTVDEDRVSNLYSQSSSVSIDEDYNHEVKNSNEIPCEVLSSSHLSDGLHSNSEFKEPFREQSYQHEPCIDLIEDLLSFDDQIFKDNFSSSYLNADSNNNTVNRYTNLIESDGYNKRKFQSSAKGDRIYRCSNLFSNEEIVEHLRRLDEDDDTNSGENSTLDAVKSGIILNLMSLDLDTDELPKLPQSCSGGSSWNFVNSNQPSMFPYAKTEGSSSSVNDLRRGPVLQDFGDDKEQYSCKPAYSVSRPQSLIPPGFSLPSREPPPGYSERTDKVIRSTPGNFSVKTCFPNNHFRTQSGGTDTDVLRGRITNSPSYSCLDNHTRPHYAAPQTTSSIEDEARLWFLMQQQSGQQLQKFPLTFSQEIPAVHQDPRFSSWDDIYGIFSSLMMDQQQHQQQQQLPQRSYDNQSSYTEISEPIFRVGNITNVCHQPGYDQMQQHVRHETGLAEVQQRNQTLGGLNRLVPGHGDHIFQIPSSADIYTRLFGIV